MLGLPASTEISKQLPKKATYAKFGLKSAQRDHFDAKAKLDKQIADLEKRPAVRSSQERGWNILKS